MILPTDFDRIDTCWYIKENGDLIEYKLNRRAVTATERIIRTKATQKDTVDVNQKPQR